MTGVQTCALPISLTQFFNQWLRRPGVAEPTIGWAYDQAAGSIVLNVLQESGSPYEFVLPVSVTDAAGTSRVLVNIPPNARSMIELTDHFKTRPRSVGIDVDNRLLARITRP